MRNLILIWIFLTIGIKASAQDFPYYSLYNLNPYVINPAYAGIEGRPFVSLSHRRQWLGIEDSHITSNITFHSPVAGGFNIGLNVTQDEYGIFQQNGALLTFGYNVPLGFNQYLSFGISGGAKMQNINFDGVDLNDPALGAINQENSIKLDGNLGLAYHVHGFNLGFSLQNVFNSRTYPQEPFEVGELGLIRNFIVTADYMLYFGNDDYIFQPFGNYRSFEGFESQWEAGGIFHIKHALWLGGSYRQDYGIIGMLGVKLKSSFSLAYAYEMPAAQADGINKSSHEINLGLAFGKKKERAKNYQTFVASRKPVKPKKEKKKKKEEPVKKDSVVVEEPVVTPDTTETVLDSLNQGGNKIRLIVDFDKPKEDTVKVVPEPVVTPDPEPEFKPAVVTKQGNHPFEIEPGHYIVVGAFGVVENAIRLMDKLISEGYSGDFGYSSDKKLFYVYVKGENSPEGARSKRDEMRKTGAYKNAWYLLVE